VDYGVDLYTWKTVALSLSTIYDFPSRGREQIASASIG